MGWFGYIAHGIGCLTLTKFIIDVAFWLYACFARPAKDLKKVYGEWAVVTGATDGIGKAMALELSKQGMKLLLVSRTQSKLDDAAKEMKGTGHETLCIDYSDFPTNTAAHEKVKKAIAGKSIGVLINNVGISYDHPEYFADLDADRVDQLLTLNIASTTYMTKLVLPSMVEAKKGAVVNVASSAGVSASPLLALYGGAKRFIIHFTQSLYGEYAPKGIHFQVQYPHLVTTKLSKVRKPSFTIPTETAYAKAAVKCIGYEREVSPYWVHWALLGVLGKLPYFVQDMGSMMLHVPLRKRALKKKAEAAKSQ